MRRRMMMNIGEPPFEKQYLTFEALESGTFSFTNDVEYSINKEGWQTLPASTPTPTLNEGDMIMWRANLNPSSNNGIGTFSSTGRYNCMGNPLSLKYGSAYKGMDLPNTNYMFSRLFQKSTGLVDASNLSLKFTLRDYCYNMMFIGCTSLVGAPELPFTGTVLSGSYAYMFNGCRSLVVAPYIGASNTQGTTILGGSPMRYMFQNCTNLRTVPRMPTKINGNYSCYYMFSGCTSLTDIPETNITYTGSCCDHMFAGCTSLTSAENVTLSGGTIGWNSCCRMFDGCTNLVTPPNIGNYSSVTSNGHFNYMFNNCTSLTSIILPFRTINVYMNYMFNGCKSLTSIRCLATSISNQSFLVNWVNGVATTGTFVKHPDNNDWTTGISGIPTGWTIEDADV